MISQIRWGLCHAASFPQCAEPLWPLYSTCTICWVTYPFIMHSTISLEGHTSGPLMMPLFSWLETGKRLPSRWSGESSGKFSVFRPYLALRVWFPLQFSLLPEFFLESCDLSWLFPTSASSTLHEDVQVRPIGIRKAQRLTLPGEATHTPPALLHLPPGPFVTLGLLAGGVLQGLCWQPNSPSWQILDSFCRI